MDNHSTIGKVKSCFLGEVGGGGGNMKGYLSEIKEKEKDSDQRVSLIYGL